MTGKHKGDAGTRSPRSGRPPLAIDIEKARKQKILDERDKNEESKATKGNPESPANTGAERKAADRESGMDVVEDVDENDPAALGGDIDNRN